MTKLDPEASTLSPLPGVLSHGLVAVSILALLSFLCSTSLFTYLTYKLLSWRRKSGSQAPINQFLFLLYNLLLADIQQSIAFLLNIVTLRRNAIEVGTSQCWAQGWFISTGDLASSVFICAIAIHTYLGVVQKYRLPSIPFYSCIAGCWSFVYMLAIIGPAIRGREFYVRASAWCWINEEFESDRLWLHYFWIFVCMFCCISLYVIIFVVLRRRSTSSIALSTHYEATNVILLYPAIYTVCTIPLAAGRIASMAGRDVPLAYFCVAGSMIACNGWLDVLLYTSTRAKILFNDESPSAEIGPDTFAFLGKGRRFGNVTTIQAGNLKKGGSRLRRADNQAAGRGSRENLYGIGLGGIGVKGEVTISVEGVQGSGAVEVGDCSRSSLDERISSAKSLYT